MNSADTTPGDALSPAPRDHDALHDRDFYTWSRQQADRLRRLAAARPTLPEALDLANLAEEIDSMGSEQRYALASALRLVLLHLLKLEYSPARYPRRGWRNEVIEYRAQARRRLAGNPGLAPLLPELLAEAWEDAVSQARQLLREDGVAPATLPATCPYSLDQLRDPDWFPVNRHGHP